MNPVPPNDQPSMSGKLPCDRANTTNRSTTNWLSRLVSFVKEMAQGKAGQIHCCKVCGQSLPLSSTGGAQNPTCADPSAAKSADRSDTNPGRQHQPIPAMAAPQSQDVRASLATIASRQLSVNQDTVYRWMDEGCVAFLYQVGGKILAMYSPPQDSKTEDAGNQQGGSDAR